MGARLAGLHSPVKLLDENYFDRFVLLGIWQLLPQESPEGITNCIQQNEVRDIDRQISEDILFYADRCIGQSEGVSSAQTNRVG
jgi:hypothetical protein